MKIELEKYVMPSIKGGLAYIGELKHNGFEDIQATVLVMTIDGTARDRLERVVEHFETRFDRIDARFDRINARFDRIDVRLKEIDSELKKISAKLNSWNYEIILIFVAFLATPPSIFIATYVYLIKPLLG